MGAVTGSLQAVSFPLLAGAALLYVSFSLTEVVTDAIKWYDKIKNKIADKGSDYFSSTGFYNYTADEIGREIVLNEERKVKANEDALEFYEGPIWSGTPQPVPEGYTNYNSPKGAGMRSHLEYLENRDKVLRKMLNDIVEGKTDKGYLSNWRLPGEQAAYLQEWYESEGGEGLIGWQINSDDNRIYDEDGNWIGPDDRDYTGSGYQS